MKSRVLLAVVALVMIGKPALRLFDALRVVQSVVEAREAQGTPSLSRGERLAVQAQG